MIRFILSVLIVGSAALLGAAVLFALFAAGVCGIIVAIFLE